MLNSMKSMFGNSPERARYKNDGYSPSFKNMMEEIYTALAGLRISWLCFSEGRCPSLRYSTLSGLCFAAPTGQNTLGWDNALSYNNATLSGLCFAAPARQNTLGWDNALSYNNATLSGLCFAAPTGQNTLGWGNALSYNNAIQPSPTGARYN